MVATSAPHGGKGATTEAAGLPRLPSSLSSWHAGSGLLHLGVVKKRREAGRVAAAGAERNWQRGSGRPASNSSAMSND